MISRTVEVRIDNRARLMSAVLAATTWPATEHTRHRHRAHVHARNSAKRVQPQSKHPAVVALQTLLDQGTPLEAIYSYALNLSWPEISQKAVPPWSPLHWDEELADFYVKTDLAAWWREEDDIWQQALEHSQKIVVKANVYQFFKPFVGDVSEQLTMMPNASYPSDREIGVRLDNELFCLVPPRIAWGDNEPWPFNEDEAHLYRGIVSEYGRLLMVSYLRQHAATIAPLAEKTLPISDEFRALHPIWSDQFTELFVKGAVALFLEEAVGPQETKAFLLMENRLHGMTILPGVVSVLKRYLSEYKEGRYERFADYLPAFPQALRVAKRVVSL